MSEYSASALRDKNKEKARRMASADPHQRVDASSWTPPEALNADVQTGMRPVSRQRFKKGGAVEGAKPKARADRKPRLSGGAASGGEGGSDLTPHEEGRHAFHSAAANPYPVGSRMNNQWAGGWHAAQDRNSDSAGSFARAPLRKSGGRAARKDGGLVNDFMNRNEKDANEERPGIKHRGGLATGGAASGVPTQRFGFEPAQSQLAKAAGLKTGGSVDFDLKSVRHGNKRPKRGMGGVLEAVSPAYGLAKNPEVLEAVSPLAAVIGAGKKKRDERAMGGALGTLGGFTKEKASGGAARKPRASGGATRGKTNINIIVSPGAASGGEPMPPPGPPPMPPMPPPKPMGPMGGMPPGGPPIGAPPPGMPMPRRRGGRADAGAGSGLGRLEKIDEYGSNAKSGESK